MCQGDYGTAEDECCSAVKPILTQWGLVPSFTTSDLGEVGKRELYREQGTGNAVVVVFQRTKRENQEEEEEKEDCFTKRTLVHTKGAFQQPYKGYAVE